MAPEDIEIIVSEHNRRRSEVAKGNEKRGKPGPQPTASNIKALSWDNELAKVFLHSVVIVGSISAPSFFLNFALIAFYNLLNVHNILCHFLFSLTVTMLRAKT